MQSLGKIAQCAPSVGAKMCCFFVDHALSPEHRAFEGRIVRTSIALPFIARFRRGFQRFLPARRRPQGLVVIGVCLSVCLCAHSDGQRAGLCPPRTQ